MIHKESEDYLTCSKVLTITLVRGFVLKQFTIDSEWS